MAPRARSASGRSRLQRRRVRRRARRPGALDLSYAFEYPDTETPARRLLNPGPVVEAIEAAGEERVRGAIVESLTSYRGADGGYRIENEWHYVVASA